MTRHRPLLGTWIIAVSLLAVACSGGDDRSAAGAEKAPAAPSALTEEHGHDEHDHPGDPDASDEAVALPGSTEDTLAAIAAMEPDHLASLHDHNHDISSRAGPKSVEPERVVIPAIGVDAHVGRSGIDGDGEMEVPKDFADTSWFTPSVKPGRVGPSVITGHVDSREGPAVFFGLSDLDAGDEIEVHGDDGEVVVFAVTAVEQHPKDGYPRDEVHGATDGAELRLITCGGIFDRSIGHYNDNIIVFAERVTA